MKHKRVLAIVLSLMMVVAFMPTLTFAEEVQDEVTCTVTVDGTTQTITKNSIAEAIEAVNEGGTITVVGTINKQDSVVLSGSKAFTLDLTGATLADGVEVKVNNKYYQCLVKKGDVYTYHRVHDIDYAQAVPTVKDPKKANVTFYCEYGHSFIWPEPVEGEVDQEASTDETTVYVATVFGNKVTWEVEKTEEDTYELAGWTVDYIKDNTGMAVRDADNKVQFTAEYYLNDKIAVDDNGDPILLKGTITKATVTQKATAYKVGMSTYEVEFTLPNGEKEKKTVENVIDTPKKAADATDELVAIQFLEQAADDEDADWGEPIEWEIGMGPIDLEEEDVAVNEDGSFTYRFVWTDAEEADQVVYGDADVVNPKAPGGAAGSIIYKCGSAIYKYDAISKVYTNKEGVSKTRGFTIANFDAMLDKKEHEALYPNVTWAGNTWNLVQEASHDQQGLATATCECSAEWTGVDDDYFHIAKTSNHTFLKNDGKDVVVTVKPTCQTKGFQYKICTQDDKEWYFDDEYYDLYDENDEFVGTVDWDDFEDEYYEASGIYPEEGHPVLVAESVVPEKAHAFVTMSSERSQEGYWWIQEPDEYWTKDTVVGCAVYKECTNCHDDALYVYTTNTVADAKALLGDDFDEMYELVEGNTYKMAGDRYIVFEGIKVAETAGADCSKANTITFTVPDKDSDQKAIPAKTITSAVYYGPHNYGKNTVTFSRDCKSAAVTQQCTNVGCKEGLDAEGNPAVRKADAVVNSVDNEDGSTTYTASLLGVALENNTKTVFDLSKAEVTFNDGEVLDLNTIHSDAQLKKLVKVTINGVEISQDKYQLDRPYEAFSDGVNKFNVVPADDADDVICTAAGVAKCVEPGELMAQEWTLDGNVVTSEIFPSPDYDGEIHELFISKVGTWDGERSVKVANATVKYEVMTYEEARAAWAEFESEADYEAWVESLPYDLDTVELTDAGEYVIFAKISKDGYTTNYIDQYFEIEPKDIGKDKIITADAQVIKYGEELNVTTGDPEIDEMIGLSGWIASTKGVGEYRIKDLVTYDPNYAVHFGNKDGGQIITIEKRNAQIVMKNLTKTWDGKAIAPEKLYTIDGLVNGDDLNVIVNTQGDKKIPTEPGTYTLNATVENNANYNVTVIPGTLKINKKAAKIKKVTPKKKTFKANKKTKKLAKNKTFKLKAKITGEKAKVTFKKANKAGKAKITVSKKGKVTVKKGLAKGTYKIKVKATKAATKHYKKATKTVTVKVVVK